MPCIRPCFLGTFEEVEHLGPNGTSDEIHTLMFRSSRSDETMQNALALTGFFLTFLRFESSKHFYFLCFSYDSDEIWHGG